ncbi:Tetratricopeptide repeat,Tetratricopeptide repeat-containing domain,Tetratricopeptide-like helical [Cinara cedri]|uniref:peptidylprolyl isomerase n=1 Tax=Cinara cedri TaxID=506608 RepID=A0A5E4M100_9HEMI|nr:Tetratricopeptide repeat,Tetratricopeptide repeat-containing domain,Tetratricopeptide-like helical [Cinara cedri]
MNRLPVYELIRDSNIYRNTSPGSSVILPLVGDKCTIVIYDVQVSENYNCKFSVWFSEKAVVVGTPEEDTSSVVLELGSADCIIDRGLEMLVSKMRVGDIQEFCLGDGQGGTITGCVRLLAVQKCVALRSWHTDDQMKLIEAARQKEAGNILFRQKRYMDAFHRFNLSIRSVLFLRDEKAEGVREKRDILYSTVCNNMAACQLKLHNYEHARVLATKVLTVDPSNLKAFLRRSQAFVELKMFDNAFVDARYVLDHCPANTLAKRYLDKAARGIEDQKANYKVMVKRMFH